ncbi:GBF-interacting protein 1 [Striga hermonthica]|uniref:GBF-interacting protein 1 n=1 Tax=Striga hermonthica TaxID=68872 RepID=A0A9N7RJV0_STRHE|nr:GBF-interacting protein 1 [Striga hermonthica]
MKGSSRVPIPDNLRGTIRNIKEIAGKHSEDDIYAMLKVCNMDPHETTQKLLYIDTFQEVKPKRNQRKVSIDNRASKEHSQRTDKQERKTRGDSNYPSNSSDGRQQRNARRDNGLSGSSRSCKQVIHKQIDAVGSACNRISSRELPSQSSNRSISGVTKDNKSDHSNKLTKSSSLWPVTVKQLQDIGPGPTPTSTPTNPSTEAASRGRSLGRKSHLGKNKGSIAVSGEYSSSSDLVLLPSLKSLNPGSAGIIKSETKNLYDSVKNLEIGQVVLGSFDLDDCIRFSDQKACSAQLGNGSLEGMSAGIALGDNQVNSQVGVRLHKSRVAAKKSVIFPNHLRVSVPKGLTFGSLFDPSVEQNNEDSCSTDASGPIPESSSPSSAHDGYTGQPVSTPPQSIQPIGESHGPLLHPTSEYTTNIVLPNVGSHLVQPPGLEQQGGSSVPTADCNKAPFQTQPGITQGSVAMPPQMFTFFRQPYPPNYIPYSPYYSQLYNYMPPQNAHQLMGHGGFTHQPPPGPIYVPQSASGAKLPVPPVYNPANTTHLGNFPYGALGYGSGAVLPSSSQDDDISGSELKDKNMHSNLKQEIGLEQNDNSHLVSGASGQDTSVLQSNVFYNFPHGLSMGFPPAQVAGHTSFAGIYHPSQSMSASTHHSQSTDSIVSYPHLPQFPPIPQEK